MLTMATVRPPHRDPIHAVERLNGRAMRVRRRRDGDITATAGFTSPRTDPKADAVTVLLASTLSTRNSTFVIRHGSRSGRTPRLSGLEGRQPVRARNDMASARPPSQFVPALV
jgi:hypothetical protein